MLQRWSKPLSGLPTIPPFDAPTYPASWVIDKTTGGDWQGRYGKDGYTLFGFDQGQDLTKLDASWVHGVYGGKRANNEAGIKSKFVGSDKANKAFLTDPRDNQVRFHIILNART